jgi:hypothetical protein
MEVSIRARQLYLDPWGVKNNTATFSFIFQTRRWYHVCIVHQRSRLQGSAATLYIDGVSVQSVRLSFAKNIAEKAALRGFIGMDTTVRLLCAWRECRVCAPVFFIHLDLGWGGLSSGV